MKSINTLKIAILSPLTERAAPLRCSLNRADAEKEMHAHWSRTIAAEPTITETRLSLSKKSLDLSLVALMEKSLGGSEKSLNLATKSLSWHHCTYPNCLFLNHRETFRHSETQRLFFIGLMKYSNLLSELSELVGFY